MVVAAGLRHRLGQDPIQPDPELGCTETFFQMCFGAVTAAIGALKGPPHSGADEAVMHMLREIGDPGHAGSWLDPALAEKRKIMDFGHRIHGHGDSRVPIMQEATDRLDARAADPE
ncbi:hypothetical protein A6A29_07110 [Streptomyces sp. TSRI0281]|nr:hypothetical protein A6A29_07110 [Streptomyces sp. TSRI0281]